MSAISKIDDIGALKRFYPLSELEYDKLSEVIENSSVLTFKKAQPIRGSVDKNHHVYLLSGSVIIAPNTANSEIIRADSPQAVQPLLTADKRPRIIADSNVTVLCVDAELLDFLLNCGSNNGFVVDEIETDGAGEWVNGLMQNEAIQNLPPQNIQILMAVIEPLETKASEVIFNQGDRPDYYYIVSKGQCVVCRNDDQQDNTIVLARLEAGDAFGEEALIANSVRGATVRMVEDGLLLRLDQRNFKRLLEETLVNDITPERAKSLRERGAEYLDLRNAAAFSKDGAGINIPFSELRNRMDSLDRDRKYIIVSDDNNMSAVAAFLLSKKHFKVYLLKSAVLDEKIATANVQTKELKLSVSSLQEQLQQVTARLQQEESNHAASKARIQSLEAVISETKDSAKKVILEASVLKNRSDSSLREQINTLTSELESEKQTCRDLSAGNQQLKNQLQSLHSEMEKQAQSQHDSGSSELNEAKAREADLCDQIEQLQLKLNALQQVQQQILTEKKELFIQFDEASQKAELHVNELKEARQQIEVVSDHAAELEAELQTLQGRQAELETALEQSLDEAQMLNKQLDESRMLAEQQADGLCELKQQLHAMGESAEEGQQKTEALSMQLTELQSRLECEQKEKQSLSVELSEANQKIEHQSNELNELQSQLHDSNNRAEQAEQALQQAQQQFQQQLEESSAEQGRMIEQLSEDTQAQARQAQQRQDSLQQKIDSLKSRLEEKESQLSQSESDYQQQIKQLRAELKNSKTEVKQASEKLSKHELRNQVLSKEMSKLQQEKKRGGFMVKLLSFVLLLLMAGAGVAYYMGIDLNAKASVLMEESAPRISQLMDAIPEQLKSVK